MKAEQKAVYITIQSLCVIDSLRITKEIDNEEAAIMILQSLCRSGIVIKESQDEKE